MSALVRIALHIAIIVVVAVLIVSGTLLAWDFSGIVRAQGMYHATVALISEDDSPVAKVSYVCILNSSHARVAVKDYPHRLGSMYSFKPVTYGKPFEFPVRFSYKRSRFGRALEYGQLEKFIVVLFEFNDGSRVFESVALPTESSKIRSITVTTIAG